MKYYVVWNEGKSEGFISTDLSDVRKAAGTAPVGMIESTLGAAFRDCYEDDDTVIEKVDITANVTW